MRVLERGTVFPSEAGTAWQSCAFPQVTVLPGGRWLVSCRAACTKEGMAGQHVRLRCSDDVGRTWSEPSAPFIPPPVDGKPGQFRALGLTSLGGARVLATLYWVETDRTNVDWLRVG